VYDTDDEGGTVPTLTFCKALGACDASETPFFSTAPDQTVFLFQIRLPTSFPPANPVLDLVLHRRPMAGTAPSSSDAADLAAFAHYRYPLPLTAPGQLLDLMVPVPYAEFLLTGAAQAPRFVAQLCVVENTTTKAPQSTAPLFVECAAKGLMPDFGALVDVMDTLIAETLPWWVDAILFNAEQWQGGQVATNSGTNDPDARYLGAIVALKEPKVTGKPSAPPPSQGHGAAH
jgi:hypothetical protein